MKVKLSFPAILSALFGVRTRLESIAVSRKDLPKVSQTSECSLLLLRRSDIACCNCAFVSLDAFLFCDFVLHFNLNNNWRSEEKKKPSYGMSAVANVQ